MDDLAARALLDALRAVLGRKYLLTTERATRRYRTGYRSGSGSVLAVAVPGSLVEQWQVAKLCHAAGVIVIPQASNTGLTGGSTPSVEGYDRDVVILSTRRLSGVYPIDDGRQVVCLAGTTLYDLERRLAPLGRQPHSVIGSSCIGASVVGGICNNSGGALIQRGPAYTQWALFARAETDGSLTLVNRLGIELGDAPIEILRRLEMAEFAPDAVSSDPARRASDTGYCEHVRKIDEATPARFNADPNRLYDASGSAGHLIVFAVRLDTFPEDVEPATFYIGTNDAAVLTGLRREILSEFSALPVSGEYIHRDAFAIAETYGRDLVRAIEMLGTDRLPLLFAAKSWIDGIASRFTRRGAGLSDRVLQAIGRMMPQHLPARIRAFHERYEHHLILKMQGEGVAEAKRYFDWRFDAARSGVFECTPAEAKKAFLHRFAVAGAAVRYQSVHADDVGGLVALDIALPRNLTEWQEMLPADIRSKIVHALYYGHFFCHVFHQDYILKRGADEHAIKQRLLAICDSRNAEYPAEHNVGHSYMAKEPLIDFYQSLDPSNSLNPGTGKTSRRRDWR